MKPAPFEYICPDTLQEALIVLASSQDAKVLAGGQSLLPMMNFRVVKPSLVIDISRLIELDYVRPRIDGGLTIGALTKHRVLETSPLVSSRFPIIPETIKNVAHLAIRNKGTIGGSLSHADPAAELPLLTLLLDAKIVLCSTRGERTIEAGEFFLGSLTTALADDEILVRVEFPGLSGNWAGSFEEVSRRPGDYALAAAGSLLKINEGKVEKARIALMGVGETSFRSKSAEELLINESLNEATIRHIAHEACKDLTPRSDLHASSDFRRHLAKTVMSRTLTRAWVRAQEMEKK